MMKKRGNTQGLKIMPPSIDPDEMTNWVAVLVKLRGLQEGESFTFLLGDGKFRVVRIVREACCNKNG